MSGPLLLTPYAEGHKENKKDMEMIILESWDTIRSDLVQTHSPIMLWGTFPVIWRRACATSYRTGTRLALNYTFVGKKN